MDCQTDTWVLYNIFLNFSQLLPIHLIFSFYMFISLSVLTVHLSIYYSICLSIYLFHSFFQSAFLSICVSFCLSICLSACLDIYISVCLSISLSSLSIYLSIYQPTSSLNVSPSIQLPTDHSIYLLSIYKIYRNTHLRWHTVTKEIERPRRWADIFTSLHHCVTSLHRYTRPWRTLSTPHHFILFYSGIF